MVVDFEWDPRKADSNLRKHGVSFDDAASVFRDPQVLSVLDDATPGGEERWNSIGIAASGRVLVVCHTFRQEAPCAIRIRLISCRKAYFRERKQYNG